jgi:flavin-dependent dehydrogenase
VRVRRPDHGLTAVPATYDVVVAGGGPAGAATALRLAAAGRSVAVLERGRFDRPRVGETLAPDVQPLLRDLGVWDGFGALRPLPSWGTRSAWDGPAPAEHSHLASGYGSGWHVDRRAFDAMLADAAAGAGAHLRLGTSVAACRHDGTGWEVATGDGSRLRGRVLVDATGRRAGPGRSLGARRVLFDRLVAVSAGWSDVDVTGERYLLVEAGADGWWYTAPLPGGAIVGMLMTDADLCRRGGLAGTARWHSRLRAAALTAARVGAAPPVGAPRVYPAASHRLVRPGDPRPWLAVGDAALAVDPISGSGVLRALRTAEAAAETAAALLDRSGDAAALVGRYESARDRACTEYLLQRAHYYGLVRHLHGPFWTRRNRYADRP